MAQERDDPSEALPQLIETLSELGEAGTPVRVGDILHAVGERSHAIVLLVPALILVSPLSGIFGLSTLTSLLMMLVIAQALLRRRKLWLPNALANRAVPNARYRSVIGWLNGPIGWIGRHTRPRLMVLVSPPVRLACWILSFCLCLLIPFLELLPFTTSIAALAIAFMAVGMVLRDGAFILAGWSVVAIFATALVLVL